MRGLDGYLNWVHHPSTFSTCAECLWELCHSSMTMWSIAAVIQALTFWYRARTIRVYCKLVWYLMRDYRESRELTVNWNELILLHAPFQSNYFHELVCHLKLLGGLFTKWRGRWQSAAGFSNFLFRRRNPSVPPWKIFFTVILPASLYIAAGTEVAPGESIIYMYIEGLMYHWLCQWALAHMQNGFCSKAILAVKDEAHAPKVTLSCMW